MVDSDTRSGKSSEQLKYLIEKSSATAKWGEKLQVVRLLWKYFVKVNAKTQVCLKHILYLLIPQVRLSESSNRQ